jgi:hypothetical protein
VSHIIGRGPYARETYPQAATLGFGARMVGLDTMQEQVTVTAETVLADAALLPPIPRNVALDPLEVAFPRWIPGDVLRITWSAGAIAEIGQGAFGLIVPLIDVGAGFKYVDNASQFPLVGVPGTLAASNGLCAFVPPPGTPPSVRLGLALYDPGGGDVILAGPTISLAGGSVASVWLQAEALPAAGFVQIPTVTLRTPPFPTT